PVAHLGRWADRAHACTHATAAAHHPRLALPDAARQELPGAAVGAGGADVGQVVVDRPVAVVVDAVAHLGRRPHALLAGQPAGPAPGSPGTNPGRGAGAAGLDPGPGTGRADPGHV